MSSGFNRREFTMASSAAALGLTTVSQTSAEPIEQTKSNARSGEPLAFPDGFVWGVATSAYQIEGAVAEDGRGPSIWDTFVRTSGLIKNGQNADIANDHYHRYRDDVKLMQALGAKAYRFSIAWPRIFPTGTGEPNPKGLDFYNRLIDELLAAGIEPFPTLYHWDLPQALQDKNGGWQSRDTSQAFADYAACIAKATSDRVRSYFTMNEFYSFVDLGHGGADSNFALAPGLRLSRAGLNQVRHNAVLAQGLSVEAIRANSRTGTRCGPADNLGTAVPAIETPEHIKAAETATREFNAPYLTAMLEGRYTDAYLQNAGEDAPRFTDEDMKTISSPVDFVGLNVYRPAVYVVASVDPSGFRAIPFNKSHPKMLSSWHLIGPEAMYWACRQAHSLWNVKEIYLTENGCGASDEVFADGEIYDSDRLMFLRNHLLQLHRATADQIPVKGYFHWSLMDNFEWNDGFETRFGLVYVDYKTQKRTPKLSASYFREAASRNAVV